MNSSGTESPDHARQTNTTGLYRLVEAVILTVSSPVAQAADTVGPVQ